MRCRLKSIAVAALAVGALQVPAFGEETSIKGPPPPGWHGEGVLKTPDSSIPKSGESGRAHTNTQIFVPVFPPKTNNEPGATGSGNSAPGNPSPH
ncbi:MAG TPA: hypothetical protein VG986_22400 [Pseudolabrys sp.]|nr:hypothetical protein [Pseudolabrys sp.]